MNKAQQKFWGSNGIQTQDSNSLSYTHHLILHITCFQRGFIAQLVEHRTGIAEVMGLNPVGASEFFLGFICNCLSYLHNCEDHFNLYSLTAVQSYDLYHIHITSKPYGRHLSESCIEFQCTLRWNPEVFLCMNECKAKTQNTRTSGSFEHADPVRSWWDFDSETSQVASDWIGMFKESNVCAPRFSYVWLHLALIRKHENLWVAGWVYANMHANYWSSISWSITGNFCRAERIL